MNRKTLLSWMASINAVKPAPVEPELPETVQAYPIPGDRHAQSDSEKAREKKRRKIAKASRKKNR